MKNFGYYKLFAVSPKLHLANVDKNIDEHISILDGIDKKLINGESAVVLFPELSLTGYTCEDLFHNQVLLENTQKGLLRLIEKTKDLNLVTVVGLPLEHKGRLYNTAAVINKGEVIGIYAKSFLPNYKEFYEKRWFTEGRSLGNELVVINGKNVPFSNNQLIQVNGELNIGIEICEDVFAPENPGTKLALAGAHLILNLSASNELVGKNNYRKDLIKVTSAKLNCGYLYASSGPWESSKDLVFGGHLIYSEDGTIIKESERMSFDTQILETEIDLQKINFERRKNTTFGANTFYKMETRSIDSFNQTNNITRKISKNPFVPENDAELESRVHEIMNIQCTGLARRMMAISPECKLVLGLSGGLDSTLALLVCVKACEKLGLPMSRIETISMPGFGTSERTKNQARDLANAFKVNFKEIDITKACKQHLEDIDHKEIDVVYENAQARERMQILFDYANKVGGFVVNTSSLSESVTGFATFGADALGNFGVNISVPKTLIRYLIKGYPTSSDIKEILKRVYETPISPELLPLDAKGNIKQSTEEILGPYELIDFFIFYYLRNGFSNEKIVFLAKKAYGDKYEVEYIEKIFKKNYNRFRKNQFKRTTLPPGVKLGVSISPRGDLRMPDEHTGDEN